MFNFLKGIGNQHLELGRLTWFAGCLAMVFGLCYSMIINKEAFLANSLTFGGGFAAILAAGGIGVGAKEKGVADAKATLSDTAITEASNNG